MNQQSFNPVLAKLVYLLWKPLSVALKNFRELLFEWKCIFLYLRRIADQHEVVLFAKIYKWKNIGINYKSIVLHFDLFDRLGQFWYRISFSLVFVSLYLNLI